MPTLIKVLDSDLKIEKKQGTTKISINTLYIERGLQVANIIAMFNQSIYDAEQRAQASITAEATLRINADSAFTSYIVNLETTYNGNFANISTQLQTLSDADSALALKTDSLEVSLNGVVGDLNNAVIRLDNVEYVYAGYFQYWDGVSALQIGNLKIEDGVTYQYVGSGEWRRYDEGALGVANQVKGWVAGASSLVVNPSTGLVTGWQYGDGSGFSSYFKISADNIELAGTTTFSSYATQTYVTGITNNLANADMSNVTSIDGGKITTNTLNASAIKANTLTGSQIYGGVIYNLGGSSSSYTMKIDLNQGELHIK